MLPRKLKNDAFAGCWFAVMIVVINCSTNCKQKKTKTNIANVLSSPAIPAGEFRILDQLSTGLTQKNIINKVYTILAWIHVMYCDRHQYQAYCNTATLKNKSCNNIFFCLNTPAMPPVNYMLKICKWCKKTIFHSSLLIDHYTRSCFIYLFKIIAAYLFCIKVCLQIRFDHLRR